MNQRNTLAGKTVVVTGGTQGIGAAVATLAVERDAAGVLICGRTRANGEQVAASSARIHYVQADLLDVEQCRHVIAAAAQRFGRIDGLVNAAALTSRGAIENTTPDLFDRIFALNVRAPFFLMQETIRHMQRSGSGGSIVNISSMSAHGGQPFISAYSASKGALNVLTKNVAHSQRNHRIRVNAVNIGWTTTPNEHKIQLLDGNSEDWLATADAGSPFGRILRPYDAAAICCFLLSDAAEMMTGSIVDFDQNVIGAYGEGAAPE